jgi:hypothetical protein
MTLSLSTIKLLASFGDEEAIDALEFSINSGTVVKFARWKGFLFISS